MAVSRGKKLQFWSSAADSHSALCVRRLAIIEASLPHDHEDCEPGSMSFTELLRF